MKFKISIRNSIFLLFISILALPLSVDGQQSFAPAFKAGENWQVMARYRDSNNPQGWSSPVYWDYSVSVLADGSSLVVAITDHAAQVLAGARLYLNDQGVSHAELVRVRRGKQSVQRLDFDTDMPIMTGKTIIPMDFPSFPLLAPSEREYTFTRNIGSGLRSSAKIIQSIQLPGDNLPVELMESSPKPDFVVSLQSGSGDVLLRQYWSNRFPLPLFGENDSMQYWLVLP